MDMTTVELILDKMTGEYGEPECALFYKTPFELLVAVILSAQCTDARVNKVTERLFEDYNTPEQLAGMTVEKLSGYIFSCGLYRSKAQNIISASKSIIKDYNGNVPSTRQELIKLAGVGQKTANVVCAFAFGEQAIAVDTHVFRVSNRIGLAHQKTPEKTERELNSVIPKDRYTSSHILLITHGRNVCKSRRPLCAECCISAYCDYFKASNC